MGEERQLLSVPMGNRGMRQSEAVFNHVRNLPGLMEKLTGRIAARGQPAMVAASARPRPVEGSYMPVFQVGSGLGLSLAAALGIECFSTTHQEGHLEAGLYSAEGPRSDRFLAVHLSGGTTEILQVDKRATGFEIRILGGSLDLHAGQLVDRVGVLMGLPFPAGPALDEMAEKAGEDFPRLASSVSGYDFSFSGAETQAERWLSSGVEPSKVARAVEACLANTLEKVIRRAVEENGGSDVLIVGGVAANRYLRSRLRTRLEHPAVGARLYFAQPALSSDNAVGTALLGLKKYRRQSEMGESLNDGQVD
ncbi:MAG: O-sialoglycoprotein endopeptidase [Firmicutes bacterium]|nr:O-sialoglycoprotein endopeptidase [Bacillota bacterium]